VEKCEIDHPTVCIRFYAGATVTKKCQIV